MELPYEENVDILDVKFIAGSTKNLQYHPLYMKSLILI